MVWTDDLRISESCLRNRMAQADDDNGSATRLTSAEKKELAELRREKRRLELETEIRQSVGSGSPAVAVPVALTTPPTVPVRLRNLAIELLGVLARAAVVAGVAVLAILCAEAAQDLCTAVPTRPGMGLRRGLSQHRWICWIRLIIMTASGRYRWSSRHTEAAMAAARPAST